MKNCRKELWFEVPTRRAFINITTDVQDCIRDRGIHEGFVLCNAKHQQFIPSSCPSCGKEVYPKEISGKQHNSAFPRGGHYVIDLAVGVRR